MNGSARAYDLHLAEGIRRDLGQFDGGELVPREHSRAAVTGLLRGRLGQDGLVITDSLQMGAITESFADDEVAVLAVEARCDLVIMPNVLDAAYRGLLFAVQSGRIGEDRIDESVTRILAVKLSKLAGAL